MTNLSSVRQNGTGGEAPSTPVPLLFWCAAVLVLATLFTGLDLEATQVTLIAAGLMLVGGLPHGAFDIALAVRAFNLGWREALVTIGLYLLVALLMAFAWQTAPSLALFVFLAMSALHFGEDWGMLEDRFLRAMAGLSVICAAGIGQPEAVAGLFNALAGSPDGMVLSRFVVLLAPVTLLVTVIGLAIAWRQGAREWALAQATALTCLMVAPPMIGFAIYFVLLHSPRHMTAIASTLSDWSPLRRLVCGAALTLLCIAAVLVLGSGFVGGQAVAASSDTFRLLSVVAAPHLLLSILLDRYHDNRDASPTRAGEGG